MKQIALLLGLAGCACVPAKAQLWCPPGATWMANLFGLAVDGCENAVYLGDTIYQGRTAQHIAVEDIIMNYLDPPQDTVQWDLYTSIQDSIVFQWTASEGWDTLYRFNAVPGDRWYPPGLPIAQSELCNAVQVTDTTHVNINGLSFRQLTCAFLDQFGNLTSNTFSITDRIGTGSMHFPTGACATDEPVWLSHTYVDDAFPFYDNGAGSNCDHFSGIKEHVTALTLIVYPNPGTDVLHMEYPSMDGMNLCLLDVTGRVIREASVPAGQVELGTAELPPGMYTVEVRTTEGRRMVQWVKR
ncbi:MAG: T9SS type A sorting domain-containing protein [Bacteroidetes bacterium]|nr:T9SS type A sorting domain-containing protein [Bacteroidota bacterium]MBS1940915.1 T9SS type A sorting domain-containing protein [Bacteroidota bacterium]